MHKTDMGDLTVLIPLFGTTHEFTSCMQVVGGIPLVRRVVLMAGKSGYSNILVASLTEDQKLADILADSHAQSVRFDALDKNAYKDSILVLASDCLPDTDFFSMAGQNQVQPDEIRVWQNDQAMLIGKKICPALFRNIEHVSCFRELVQSLTDPNENTASVIWLSDAAGMTVRDRQDCIQAEDMLLSRLVKDSEGWMARHINRKISLAVTRRLMHTSVTPDHMTWVSMLFGLAGAVFFLFSGHGMQVSGAILFLLHSILDGCDGELARLKYMESRFGGILDFWSDNLVHVAVFAAMGIGWASRSPDSLWPGICAVLAVGGSAISAGLVYFHTMHAEKKSGPLYTSVSTSENKSSVVRIADVLSRRDFIYLVLLLALFDHTHWFLVMTAIGAPIYAILLISIIIREKTRA